jgi:hydrophobic/amphiphilic exporter-1 (mainly G- bacteria), HAE1 family
LLRSFIAGTVLRPVTTTMVTVAILVFGLVAATRLPVELLPDLSYPTITVETTDPDAAPGEIEELVTRPIEERVGAVPGVVRIESVSREGQSEVVLDFEWGTRIDQAMADVREKLDRVTLPLTATRPIVLRYDPSQEPIMRLALRGPERGGKATAREELAALRELADRVVKRELEKLPGVAAVQLHGGELDEVLVEVDPERLAALGVTTEDVVAAIRRDNVNRPGGAVSERENRYLVRTLHESRTPEELGQIILRSQAGAELRLHDVARVRRAPVDREELSLVGGPTGEAEAVELAVYREGDANIVAAAARVEANLGQLPLPPGHEVIVLSSQAGFIESAVDEVRSNTLVGGALAVMVLLFFLRNLRSTAVIAVAIPISLLATFVPLSMLDVSLNVMSLGGLALGVGMLVDNSIVVLESIARVRESGTTTSHREQAVIGTAEVAPSVVASTLTTVAVFFPMSFVEGVAGQLVRDLSYAVSFSLVSSMLVSLTLVPVLQSFGERPPEVADEPTSPSLLSPLVIVPALLAWPVVLLVRGLSWLLGWVSRPLTFTYDAIEGRYPALLRIALRFRSVVLLGALGVCIITMRLADEGGRTLLPEVHQGEFFVQVALPQGASLPRTTRTMQTLSAAIAHDPEVDRRFTRVGSVTQAGSAGGGLSGTHLGQLNVRLHPDVVDREAAEARLLAAMQEANPESQATLRLGRPALFTFGPPIEVQVYAEDPRVGAEHARRLLPGLQAIEALVEVVPDDLSGRPEVRVRFDRERLGRLGIGVDAAALAVQRAIQGEVATTLYSADRQLEVRVQLPSGRRSDVEHVRRIPVGVVDGIVVELGAVAEVEPSVGPAEIRRIDGRRGLRIRARVDSVDLGGVAEQVRAVLAEHEHDDPRVEAFIAGQADEMELSLRSLVFTAALSIFLVYVVMASSFESLLHPFLIMFTVPLALAGVGLVCWLTQTPLSAMVGIGVVVLAGIVVNNAIVLINAVNDRRGSGLDVGEALVQAGHVRVRPILMTTLTTVLGLTPMALGLGEGAALRQPLALAVIGGLSIATILTLIVIPCAYSLLPGRTRDAWKQE